MSQLFVKDPDATLDYGWDFASEWLPDGDSIDSFTVTVTSGDVTVEEDPAPSESDGVVTAWISGGTEGTRADVTCHVVTAQGRKDDITLHFQIREQ